MSILRRSKLGIRFSHQLLGKQKRGLRPLRSPTTQPLIACKLTTVELQRRRNDVLQKIKTAVINVIEIEDGFRYEFTSTRDQIAQLGNLIELEHECCPFLTFRLTVEPAEGPALLELTGPEGTKDFLRTLFD